MDVERTIQFILESQAKAEIRMHRWEDRAERSDLWMQQWEARADKSDARMEQWEARMERSDARAAAMEKRLDRRMDAITKLLQQGMRMLVKSQSEIVELRKAQRRTDAKLAELAEAQKELAEAQKETQRTLRAFMNSLRNGRNGR